jgi:DNA-dependent RNA polymerase auxiliary subunit epsilon
VYEDGNVSKIAREAFKNKSFNVTSAEQLEGLIEDIMKYTVDTDDFSIGAGTRFEIAPEGVT